MRSSFLTVILSIAIAGCVAGDLESTNPPPPAGGPDAAPPAPDAAVAGRVTEGLQLLYHFGGGSPLQETVTDLSGVGNPYNLTVGNPANLQWLPTTVIVQQPTILTAIEPAVKVYAACSTSNEVTIEGWLSPADVGQNGPARIATFSGGNDARNFTLAQAQVNYDFRLRTSETDLNGTPAVVHGPVNPTVMQHVVYTRNALGTVTVYLDNTPMVPDPVAGNLEWSSAYQFAIANEIGEQRPWLGQLGLIAVYCRALTPPEVTQNYNAGF